MSLRHAALRAIVMAAALAAALASNEVIAQTAEPASAQQILDRVYSFNANSVLNLASGNAAPGTDFTATDATGNAISVCALTSVSGLFCLDGKTLRKWTNPQGSPSSSVVLSCADAALGLDGKSDGCTGMVVDQAGAIWLAGKKKNGHSVIKVVKKSADGGCPAGWVPLTSGAWCAQEYYSGRPVLVDFNLVDGEAAEAFGATGVIGIEERKSAVFFPDPKLAAPRVLVSAREWGLSGSETLQDVTLLQIPVAGAVVNYVLATTSTGRILAKDVAASGNARAVFNVPQQRGAGAVRCNTDTQQYGVRSSTTAALVYVSDRNFCQVIALQPPATGSFTSLLKVQKNGEDLVLSTAMGGDAYPPLGLTVAPGYSFQIADCVIRCAVVNGGDGDPAAQFLSVELVPGTSTDAVAFQIKGIPDCRYAGAAGFPATLLPTCATSGIVLNPDANGAPALSGGPGACAGPCPPAAQWLNVTPLLPADVISAFIASGLGEAMPPLLISPQFRGQAGRGHVFEALFVLPNPQLRFRDTFEGEYFVDKLHASGSQLGCFPVDVAEGANLIRWDVVTTVSEVYRSIGGNHVDTLTNIGCGSARVIGVRFSLLPYDLEITPDTWGPTHVSVTPSLTVGNDAVFARLLQKLYGDLFQVQTQYACQQADPVPTGGIAPLATNLCNTLSSIWQNGKIKLDSCVNAAFDPKQSAGNENCQSFVSQLSNYQSRLPAATSAADVANRIGELKARIQVIWYIYDTFFLPSVPAGGFCREAGIAGCANPWL